MRLWHYKLISKLPRQQLLGQHRECCALRGKSWGKSHSVVNYVFRYPYGMLFNYHLEIMAEMENRGYNITFEWLYPSYRGKAIGYDYTDFTKEIELSSDYSYPEHNDKYLQECLDNLKQKGIIL